MNPGRSPREARKPARGRTSSEGIGGKTFSSTIKAATPKMPKEPMTPLTQPVTRPHPALREDGRTITDDPGVGAPTHHDRSNSSRTAHAAKPTIRPADATSSARSGNEPSDIRPAALSNSEQAITVQIAANNANEKRSTYARAPIAKKTASATHSSQTATTTTAATRLTGFSPSATSRAFSWHSSMTCRGIIFAAISTPMGTTTISSNNPTPGMKSGMGSIGLKTYPTMRAAKTLAYQGVLGWRYAR